VLGGGALGAALLEPEDEAGQGDEGRGQAGDLTQDGHRAETL
jgi:hypothetical protein